MTDSNKALLGDVPEALMALVRAQLDLSRGLFESLTGAKVPSLGDQVRKLGSKAAKSPCHIPPPCWMPQPLGECVSHVSDCGKACVRLVITNCDRVPRTIDVRVKGAADLVTVSPASVTIDPMDCKEVELCLEVPRDTPKGHEYKSIVWVEGCKQHYLVWKVSVGTLGVDSCHEVEVEDCPDYVHHWYDHFYCVRPCFNQRGSTGVVGTPSHGFGTHG